MRRYRLRDLGMILSFNFVFSDEELLVSICCGSAPWDVETLRLKVLGLVWGIEYRNSEFPPSTTKVM
jgi:hypothetical protein